VTRRAYYTLHFVAKFDQAFASTSTWQDDKITKNSLQASGGTGVDDKGFPVLGKGSGAWIDFGTARNVQAKVAISYVSIANAEANLAAEIGPETSFEQIEKITVMHGISN